MPDFPGRHARGIHVADELHISAERDRRDLPAGAVAVIPPDQFRPETDREGGDSYPAPAPDPEVPEFVHEHDDREHDEKGHQGEGQ